MSSLDSSLVGNVGPSDAQQQLNNFWAKALDEIKSLKTSDFKTQELPLARIKKIMKLDEDVKMISAEAPALFAKAAEFFISELTLRAWIHAEDNKRRTLQRNDIAMAITKYDQFDFLIDIVPREEIRPVKRPDEGMVRTVVSTDQVQYYFQMAQPQQQQQQAQAVQQTQTATVEAGQSQVIQVHTAPSVGSASAGVAQQQSTTPTSAPQSMQVYTQVVTPSGEVQQIPIQLTPSQIQAITQQMQGKQPNQPIVIQTPVDTQTSDTSNNNQFVQQPMFQLPMYAQQVGQTEADQSVDNQVDQ